MNRNCPNCGAPYDINEIKCPFCGTLYLDLSCIDFDNRQPVFLKIKSSGQTFVQRVIPTIANIEVHWDTYDACGIDGRPLSRFVAGCSSNIQIEFQGVN